MERLVLRDEQSRKRFQVGYSSDINKFGRGPRGVLLFKYFSYSVLKYEHDRKRLRVGSSTYLKKIFPKNIDLFYFKAKLVITVNASYK